jgi:DNA repair exonuclease SbcCD ATPase subunit
MYIHKISIHNIRGFAHLDFDLRRPNGDYAGWTVFTGDNGAGKSTFLKVIALSLLDSGSPMQLLSAVDGWIRRSPTEEIDQGYA